MQKLLFVPLGLALGASVGAGCTPASDASGKPDDYIVNSKAGNVTTKVATNAAAKTSKAPAKVVAKAPAKVPAKMPAKVPVKVAPKLVPVKSPYRIEAPDPRMPAEMVAALKKVMVAPPPASFKLPQNPRVKLVTNKGEIVVALNPKEAPLHARSFYYLAKRGFFDGTVFHRFADLTGAGGNIIQGGDPLTRDVKNREFWGAGGPGYRIPRERNALKHEKLVIAAARTQDPDSAGSGFYITQNPVGFLDEGDGYTVFGKVASGQSVALKLLQDDVVKKAVALP